MPNPLRVVARILTGSTYVVLGADALLSPGKRPEIAGETLAAIRTVVPLPEDDTLLVQANAAVMVGAARAQKKIHFWKYASLLGGLLLVVFD